jgi:PAS domain S-box-containing protein
MEITILFIGEMEATFTAGRFQDRASSADMTSLEVTGMTGDYREYESDCDYFQKILDQPALAEMRDLAALAQRVFQTPIAFLAMLDHTERMTARIGVGEEWWSVIEGFPLHRAFEDALIAPDTARWLPQGSNAGGLGFFVATPVRSCNGLPLGLLILADHAPRPGFSEADRQALRTLVNAFTANMELRALASHALEGEFRLVETEKRFRAIANSAPVLIIYGGPEGAPMFVNNRWLEFTGRSIQEEMGDGWSDSIHPQYRQSVREAFARAFEDRTPFVSEYPLLRKDGEYRWMHGHGEPRYLENGTFMGYVGCLIDVTGYHDSVMEIERLKQLMAVPA